MYVYKIINLINKKCYIGITNNIEYRFKYHKTRYNKTSKQEYIDKPLYKAFRKYGIENFKFIILYNNVSVEKAKLLEVFLIRKFQSLTHQNGYNITKGGDWRSNLGLNNNTSILSEAEALDIRDRASRGETLLYIYNIYKDKVAKSSILNIINGNNWKHLGAKVNFMPSGGSLNYDTIRKIKSYYEQSYTPKQISSILNLEYRKVWRICKGKTYANL